MPPKKEGEKNKDEKNKDEKNKAEKGKGEKNKDEKNSNEKTKDKESKDEKNKDKKNKISEKSCRKPGEGVTVGYVDKPKRCVPDTSAQFECSPPPPICCPPPSCSPIPSCFPEKPRDCSTSCSEPPKPKNLDFENEK